MATTTEKAYFDRIAKANQTFEEHPPGSLQEMFDRLQDVMDRLGVLARPGDARNIGDMASHHAYLKRLRSLDPDYHPRVT